MIYGFMDLMIFDEKHLRSKIPHRETCHLKIKYKCAIYDNYNVHVGQ